MVMLQVVDGVVARQEAQDAFAAETRAKVDTASRELVESRAEVAGKIAEVRTEVVEARAEARADAARAECKADAGQDMAAAAHAAAANHVAGTAFKTVTGNHGYMTILAYGKVNGIEEDPARMSTMGKEVTRSCRDRGIAIRRIRDGRYGSVNRYPESVIPVALAETN
jgi:hypothetical protein